MKKIVFYIILLVVGYTGTAQQTQYNVTSGNGNGLRFWNSDYYKIHMGTGTEYAYGPVTNYSIKSNMNSTAGRGWTWGVHGQIPVAGLSNTGDFKIDGTFTTELINMYNEEEDAVTGYIQANTDGLSMRSNGDMLNLSAANMIECRASEFVVNADINFFRGEEFNVYAPNIKLEGNISLDNYTITSQGGSAIGLGSGGIGNENDDITLNIVNDGELEVVRDNVNVLSIGDHILLGRNNNKNVGIGTTSPKNKLSVNGTIWAKEVKVSLTDAADWVFEEDYELRPLEEVADYIKENKHLPEIPSAEEFRQHDMKVSEMTNKLLQKIEELTLYAIDQKEVNTQLQERVDKLEAIIIQLSK